MLHPALSDMTASWAQRWQGRDRIVPAIAALLVNVVIGYALIIGLRAPSLLRVADSTPLALFDLEPPQSETEPEPPPREKEPPSDREGGATADSPTRVQKARDQPPHPSNLASPEPIIRSPAPILSASPIVSLDSGAGGTGSGATPGSGSGSGGSGTGTGRGNGEGGSFSQARQTNGRFRNSDFPNSLRGVGRVTIGVRYAIGPSGHVDRCEVIEGSGYPEIDAMTCRVIMERYRFRPARDPDGYAVTEVRAEDYRWRVR